MRQRVVAILTAPLRFVRRLLGLLLRPLRLLPKAGTPLRKLAGLRGKPRIAAFVILGVVVVIVVLALRPGPNEEKDVRATLDRYAQATRAKDYQALCDDLFARDIVSGLTNVGLPCEVALRNSSFETVRNPQLQVLGVEVSGDQALARTRSTAVGEADSLDTIKLVKQDGNWRVASLSQPGAAASAATTAP
jgi:ketosteroid isomerase-like protein